MRRRALSDTAPIRTAPIRTVLVSTALISTVLLAPGSSASTASAGPTTAWRNADFHVDVPGVVGHSDVVLGQPNTAAAQAMPLGNGSLGAGVWAANGFTAQLNRADTLPDRLSPGQLVIPGLSALTGAADYEGRLNLYDGTLTESGGGLTATAYVRADTDERRPGRTAPSPARAARPSTRWPR